MRYLALAADYDGTLAHHGRVDEETIAALERLRRSGRRLIMVTGRELDELKMVFDRFDLFDRIVAENGALLYDPETRGERPLGEPPPEAFIEQLKNRVTQPVSVGRVIVATWEPAETVVLELIQELGLELQVIFNKGAVMILPSGVNKAFGLAAALRELKLSPHNVVAVGDAENDHALLQFCECSAAVSNALPSLKERADIVTAADHGAGVAEVIDQMVADDLAAFADRLGRHRIPLGQDLEDDADVAVELEPYGHNVLVAGTSGSGKSTLTTGLLERFADRGYQYLIIDPEGDYSTLEGAVVLGDPHRAPLLDEILELVDDPEKNVVVNLLGIALEHRPSYFAELLPRLLELRTRTGRPHWIVVDEAHHLIPNTWDPATMTLPEDPWGLLLITVHPESLAQQAREDLDTLIAIGMDPAKTIRSFCESVGHEPPDVPATRLETGEALVWQCSEPGAAGPPIRRIRTSPPRSERTRHNRKYAEGHVGADRCFRFRGPEGKLQLMAQNLTIFLQMAEGVDDETWTHHLRNQDYSEWFRLAIKDAELSDEVRSIEEDERLDPQASRHAVREAVERRYTLPADEPTGEVTAD